jgi:putative hemolysin
MTARATRTDGVVMIICERPKGKVEWANHITETEAWELFKSLSKLFAKGKKK